MFSRLLYPILILATNFCHFLADKHDRCPPLDIAESVPDFWPWAKQKLVEEIGQNDQNDDKKLINKLVNELAEEDKLMEQELKLHELKMGKSDDQQNAENPKKKKWFQKNICFRRSKIMKPKFADQNGEQQEQSGRLPSYSSSQDWLRSFSFRRPSSQNLKLESEIGNSSILSRSYSMRQNPEKIDQLIKGDKNCVNDRKMEMQLYKESKQFQREIMGGKMDQKCIVAKFEAIKTQIYKLMDTVTTKFGITIKKEYDIELEKPEKYSNQAMVRQMAKMWITVGKGAEMDKIEMANVLDMLRSVIVMAESNLLEANNIKGRPARRRRKRVDGALVGLGFGLVAIVLIAGLLIKCIFFNNTPVKCCGITCCP